MKITAGLLSGSSALLADGYESGGDVLSSGLVWLGLTYGAKPPDSNHPYGHGRAETVSGLIVGLLLVTSGLAIALQALVTANHPGRVPAAYAVFPLTISIAVKVWMVRLKWVTGRRIGSAALAAVALNDSVDMLSGVVALSALWLTLHDPARFPAADHYGACVVGIIMLFSGMRIARKTGMDLMDTMPETGLIEEIRQVAAAVPGVHSVEKVYARKTGLRHHVDMHLWVDPAMNVRRSHELGHRVENLIMRKVAGVADVLVHMEPADESLRGLGYEDRLPEEAPVTKLLDSVLDASETRFTPEPFGEVHLYFEGPTDLLRSMTAGSLILKPGMSPHPPHRHAEEELLLVAEGTGEIRIGERIHHVGPGTQMYCAGNILHGITNTGSSLMKFYFYKWLA